MSTQATSDREWWRCDADVMQRDVDDEQVKHAHHVRQSESGKNDARMAVLVFSGGRCGRGHSSAFRDQDHAAAQVAGFGAFVDHLGVRQKPALADVQAQLAGVDQGAFCAAGPRPGDVVRVAGQQGRE